MVPSRYGSLKHEPVSETGLLGNTDVPLSAEQLAYYRLSFELKVRKTSGTAFQDFFSTVAERRYGGDFVRVRPMGTLGDKGCDGYHAPSGKVYQCYGKASDTRLETRTLVAKVFDDYALAAGHLPSIMREWHFVHNLVDGVPVEFVEAIETLKTDNPARTFGQIGPVALGSMVLELAPHDLFELLGPAASAADNAHLRLEVVAELVRNLVAAIDAAPYTPGSIAPVPVDKLEFNGLPTHWRRLIELGAQNVVYVEEYLARLPNPVIGSTIATSFNNRYRSLKQEGLTPDAIMNALYEAITGAGLVLAERQVAAYAILAWLFKSCDIFEDKPAAVPA